MNGTQDILLVIGNCSGDYLFTPELTELWVPAKTMGFFVIILSSFSFPFCSLPLMKLFFCSSLL